MSDNAQELQQENGHLAAMVEVYQQQTVPHLEKLLELARGERDAITKAYIRQLAENTALQKQLELADEDPELGISMTAQAAVATLKEICKDAESCGEDCPIYGWCQSALPDNRAALPPKYWPLPE